jgi:hypothetical protein
MQSLRELIRDNCRRLDEALPDGGPFTKVEADPKAADQAVAGVVIFENLGEQPTPVGRSNIDWSAPQHRHQEWPAQLNRFFQLPPLAAAYRQTGRAEYAEAARDYITDWMRAHPTREHWQIAPYDNTLNLCIRVLEWFTAAAALLDSPAFDDAVFEAMCDSARVQLDYLCEHLSSRTNWRIAQADSLLTTSLRLDGLPGAERWRRVGLDVLNDAFHRQILPDGAHEERTPGYHHWMTQVFEMYWRLGRAIPELGLVMTAGPVARMHDYALATTRPNGALNAMHDSVGRRTGSEPNRVLAEREAFRRDAGLPDELPPTSQVFPCAGQAFFRDGWGENATYVTFDATTWGGGHCHLSRGALQVHAGKRSLLVDPGYLTYEASDPFSAYGRSTRAHSTVNLNGWNQSEADPVSRFLSVPGYDLAACRYDGGYWPGDYTWSFRHGHGDGIYAWHDRTMLWVRGRFVAVLDQVHHDDPDRRPVLESNYQLCECEVATDPGRDRAWTCNEDSNLLLLFPLRPPGARLEVHEGEREPLRGWLPGQGQCVPAPQVSLVVDPAPAGWADLAAVLVPFAGQHPPRVEAEAAASGGANRLTLRWPDGTIDALYWTGCLTRSVGTQEGFETDASLVHLTRQPDGRPCRGLAVDATFLRPFAPDVHPAPETFTLGGS